MQKTITTIILIILLATNIKAQDFYVKSFVQTSHISGRVDNRTDDNNQDCAIINIETNLIGLEFDCTYGFCADVEYDKKGTYRLYVSPGERKLKIMKEGYMPEEYIIELPIVGLNTYKMQLTHKGFAPQDETTKSDFVKIYSTPEGADVYINGEQKGITPYEQPVPEGSYIYLIRKEKYYDAQGSLQVVAGSTPEINETLKPKFGKFIISSSPSGADISINNKPTGKRTPATFDFQDPGKYNIMLQKFKYQAAYKTFTLAEGNTENIKLTLTPDFAGITIKTTPENGANIELDGKPLNQTTPYTIPELTSGNHKIRVTKKMYKPGDKTITVKPGQSQTITINMQPTFAELTINTTPSDASIYINGNYVAKGTYIGKQNEGLCIIEIKKDKYKTRNENITITAGIPLTKTYKLQARKGNIAITTSPTKAEIYIGGELKGTSPLMLYDLIIGDYNVEARKTGYAPSNQKVTITEGQTTNTKLTLESGLTITINSKPQGASLYINGSYKGKAPQTLVLNFGEHKIKLTGISDYKDTEHTISIKQYGKTSYTLNLESKALKCTDRNGKTYKTVKIGSQNWMAENLAYKASSGCWAYDNNSSNVSKYGYLYNYETAKNVCPQGWHLPSDDEWEQLAKYINSKSGPFSKSGDDWKDMGKLLKAKTGWENNGNGTNRYGFTALPGGNRSFSGSFIDKGCLGYWWSSTTRSSSYAWYRYLYCSNDYFYRYYSNKSSGFSVRCVGN